MTQPTPVYDIFLSYAPADEAWVDGYLLDALRASGLKVLTAEAFRPGVPLLQEYERAIVQSRYVVLVLSPAWTGDRFGEFVDLLATFHGNREGSWPVVPLILQPVELPLRLAHLVPVDATTPERWPAALEKIARLLDASLAPAQEVPDCPYPGMTPFTTEQESLFFGRDREIADAVERLRLHPFLCVIGPSGSGKSSLVYAGVIPALRRSRQFGSGGSDIRTLRPGAKPLTALGVETQNFASLHSAPLPGNRTLLFIDQFEELFTQSDPAQVQPFLDALQTLIGQPNLHILLTVRADFYPELMGCSLWPAIGANRLDLPPLGRAELAAAIVQPAAQVAVNVDPLLVERLTADAAGEKGALPLVQECLRLLWQRVARRYLPAAAYAGMAEGERNGLQIAIDRRASVVYSNLPADAQPIARRIFLRLIQFGEGRADTRRQVVESDLRAASDDPALFADTLQTLIDRRLLTASGEEKEGVERRIDIAHEALIGGWTLLRGWIDERRAAEQTRRRLESTAQRWEELERAGGLLDPVELAEAQRWLAQPDSREVGGASDSLAALIEASETHIQEEEEAKQAAQAREVAQAAEVATLNARRETEQAQARRRTFLLAAALLSAVVVIAVVGWFWRQSQISEAEAIAARQAAKAGELAGQALAELDLDANGSKALPLLLARQAVLTTWQDDGTVTDAAIFALKIVVDRTPFRMNLPGHGGFVISAAFSPDGFRIVTASDDNTAKVWNAGNGDELFTLAGHTGSVWSAAFSPDGERIVTASSDGTAKVWDAQIGTQLFTLVGHTRYILSAAFSPNGERIVTASDDNTAKVWNANSGDELLTLSGHSKWVLSAAFSPDGARILTASGDGTAKVWDAQNGSQLLTLSGHTGSVWSAAFSPDGQRIVTASVDRTAKVWDAQNGSELLTLSSHTEALWSAAFNPDGQRIVTASSDRTAKVWDARTGSELLTLAGHTDSVRSAAYSPDGERVVTASNDNTAKVWDARSGQELLILSGHTGSVLSAAYNPDGQRIVTASDDQTAKVWDAQNGSELFTLSGHTGFVLSAAFSPDGQRIVTASSDRTAKVWDARTGSELLTLAGHTDSVRSAAYSPDGERVVTASNDNTAKVWDARSGQELLILSGHTGSVLSAAYNPDGQRIVTASDDQTAKVWDARTGSELLTLSGHTGDVHSAAFSPDGQRIVTASVDRTAKVWDARTGSELLTLAGHAEFVWSAAFSPDGQRIVTANHDQTAKVWDARSGQELLTLAGHKRPVATAAYSPDGSRIVTASDDGTARIWLMPDALLAVALARVQRDPPDFTPEEKARYGIGE